MISPGRLLWLLRRDFDRGWDATFHHYRTLPLIGRWSWPHWNDKASTVPVHVLTGKDDWPLAAWMLASLFHFSETAWPVVIHDDGTLPEEGRTLLQRLFPNTRFISRQEADTAMATALRPYSMCRQYRNSHPLGLKIFDMAHFAASDRFLALDSDVLFFQPPREITEWSKNPDAGESWFNEDVQEGSLISPSDAQEQLGVRLWPRVNSGLCLIQRRAIDFGFCDHALGATSILRGHIWRVEQTLFALCASRHGRGGLLPKTYEVTLNRDGSPEAITRHYVGAVRQRFFGEGLKRLRRVLLAPEAPGSAIPLPS
jgi:hypothetical protein